jgi:hypothetical protein
MTPKNCKADKCDARILARLAGHPAVFGVMSFGTRVKTLQSLTSDRDKLERLTIGWRRNRTECPRTPSTLSMTRCACWRGMRH